MLSEQPPTTKERKRLNREGWGAQGAWELWDFSCWVREHLCLPGSQVPGLWPTYNFTAGSSQLHRLEHFALGGVGQRATRNLAPHMPTRPGRAAAGRGAGLSGCSSMRRQAPSPPTQHTQPTRRALLHGTTFGMTNKGEAVQSRDAGQWELSGTAGPLGGQRGCRRHCLWHPPSPEGGQGARADLQGNCSQFPDTSLRPVWARTRGQAGLTGHCYTHPASRLQGAPAGEASAP